MSNLILAGKMRENSGVRVVDSKQSDCLGHFGCIFQQQGINEEDLLNTINMLNTIEIILLDALHTPISTSPGEIEDCDFGECSVTCGGGWRRCERTCRNGQWGQPGCPLESQIKAEKCNDNNCPGEPNLTP